MQTQVYHVKGLTCRGASVIKVDLEKARSQRS